MIDGTPARARRLPAFVALCLQCAVATAGSIQINPIRIELSAAQPSATLTLRNNDPAGSPPAILQVDSHRWTQADSQTDTLEPAAELKATPPLFTLPPGGEQIVRIGLPGGVRTSAVETSYRLIVQQVPQQAPSSSAGLQVLLRFSIPVFVLPADASASGHIEWSLEHDGSALSLSARNSGSRHLRLDGLELRQTRDGGVLPLRFTPRYVLPGALRSWRIEATDGQTLPAAGERLKLKALAGQTTLEADLTIGAPAR